MKNKIKKKLLIIHNLPKGGAKVLFESNINYLKKYYELLIIKEPNPHKKGIFNLLYHSLFMIPKFYKYLFRNIDYDYDLIIAYHSWITKSPLFFQYAKKPVIYICHEGLREYYDKELVHNFRIKDWIVYILKIPIMMLDKRNVTHASKIITNSKFSKKIIDNYYSIKSIIIYPGTKKLTEYYSHKKINNRLSLMTTSSLFPHKRVLFILQVIHQLQNIDNIDVELKILFNDSNPNYKKLLDNYIKVNNLKVKYYYQLSDKKKYSLLNDSSAFIYCPINEPYGLAIIEAYNFGIPIFAYKSGGYIENINKHDSNVKIISSLKVREWSKCIIKKLLLKQKLYTNNRNHNVVTVELMNRQLKQIIIDTLK